MWPDIVGQIRVSTLDGGVGYGTMVRQRWYGRES